jgi:ABC-type proline/glycine betaine transport system permease subunit
MKRRIPLLIVLLTGIFGAAAFFIPHPIVRSADEIMRNDVQRIIAAFSLVLGVGSIVQHHLLKIKRRAQYYPYSYITIIALLITAIIGVFGGIDVSRPGILPTRIGNFSIHIQTLYSNIMVPLAATMFSLLAFFMASAAYRAFRARNLEATLLLLAAFIVMLGAVPLGRLIHRQLPAFAEWILAVPNTASKRGILFGVELGIFATSLKIILGIERGWLGGGK